MVARRRYPKKSGKFRSQFERNTAAFLTHHKIPFEYEKKKIGYTVPAKNKYYLPDFYLINQGIYIETKGEFDAKDREKHLLVRKQHPDKDIRLVFWNAQQPIYKGSSTTYAMWCDKHRFLWAQRKIPKEWLWPNS